MTDRSSCSTRRLDGTAIAIRQIDRQRMPGKRAKAFVLVAHDRSIGTGQRAVVGGDENVFVRDYFKQVSVQRRADAELQVQFFTDLARQALGQRLALEVLHDDEPAAVVGGAEVGDVDDVLVLARRRE